MVAPGSRSHMSRATSAPTRLEGTAAPRSSTRNTRSASPSKASPTSAPSATTLACSALRFSGLSGSAGWLGKLPSSSKYIDTSPNGRPWKTAGTT
jgi:hypothetical protein